MVKNPPTICADAGDPDLIPGSGRSPGEGNGNPLQYSCLGNPMERRAWWTTVHGVTKAQTPLSEHVPKDQWRSLGIRATWGVNRRWEMPGWESTLNKPPNDSIRQKSLINTRLGQCFSNFNVHRTHLGILLRRDSYSVDMGSGKGRFRFHPSYKLSGKSMLLVHGSHLSGRGLEDLPLMEQISFALFLNHRLHCPTSGRIP